MMPSLSSIGDVEAVDNRFIRKIVFYVEGRDDQVLLQRYVLKDFHSIVEIKQPREEGSGYHNVIRRVSSERERNPRIFGVVDGETLLALGKVREFIELSNCRDWIEFDEVDGVFFCPCWELENFFLSSRALEAVIPHMGHIRSIARFSMKKFRLVLIWEAVRLAIWATLNFALAGCGKSLVKAETRTNVEGISKIRREVRNLQQANLIPKTAIVHWRRLLADKVDYSEERYRLYDQLLGRIDGKALYIRIRRKFGLGEHILGALARVTHDADNGVGLRLVEAARAKSTE